MPRVTVAGRLTTVAAVRTVSFCQLVAVSQSVTTGNGESTHLPHPLKTAVIFFV